MTKTNQEQTDNQKIAPVVSDIKDIGSLVMRFQEGGRENGKCF